MKKTILLLLLFFISSDALKSAALWLPKGGGLFKPLLADPEEVQIAGKYFSLNDLNTVDFNLGVIWGFRRWQFGGKHDWLLQWDLSGVVIPRFLVSANINQLEAADFTLNLPLEVKRNAFSSRITLFHKSAHLGDNYIQRTKQPRITYSREGIQWLGALEPAKFLRIYTGGTWLLHTIPQLDRAELQAGLEIHGPYFRFIANHQCYLYLSQDIQSKQEVGWNINSNTQFGMLFGFKNIERNMRFFLNYFSGRSIFGQFYQREENFLSAGVGFDFQLEDNQFSQN